MAKETPGFLKSHDDFQKAMAFGETFDNMSVSTLNESWHSSEVAKPYDYVQDTALQWVLLLSELVIDK